MARIDPSAVWDFAGEIVGRIVPSRATTTATVTRVDPDGTTWVTTGDGGEAPATSVAAGVSVGDTVTLEWDGSAMGIRSNVSDPAPPGRAVMRATEGARSVADAAQRVADAVNQHFFADGNGIHVTEATQDEWDASHSGANVLINSIGQLFRDGLNNLLTLTTENGARALTVWDGLGNTSEHIRAIIGEIIQLGSVASGNFVKLDDSGLEVYNEEKTDGYSAKIGATFAEFLGGLLKLRYDVQGTSDDPIYVSAIRHKVPNEIGLLGFLEFKTLNAGKSNEKTVASIAANEVNVYGQLTGSISTAFDVTTVQLMEGATSIAAGGSTSTATAIGTHALGWYPIGIVGWACNYGEITLARCRISNATEGDATVEYVAHNTGTTARKPNLNVRVLWVRMGDY